MPATPEDVAVRCQSKIAVPVTRTNIAAGRTDMRNSFQRTDHGTATGLVLRGRGSVAAGSFSSLIGFSSGSKYSLPSARQQRRRFVSSPDEIGSTPPSG
jgi:hypothetical protein